MRRCDRIRLAASASFNHVEVDALHSVVTTVLRGGDARQLVQSPALRKVAAKVERMRATVADKRALREVMAAEIGTPDPTRQSPAGAECAAPSSPPTNTAVPAPAGLLEQARSLAAEGLRQDAIARRLGVAKTTVQRWLAGERTPGKRAPRERFAAPRREYRGAKTEAT